MYYNVFGYNLMNTIPDRYKVQANLIADCNPDIVCVQEFDKNHRANAKTEIESYGYSEVPVDSEGNVVYACGKNCESIFYKSDRVTLIESGGEMYPETVTVDGIDLYGNNSNTKSMTWAIFEEKATGAKLLAVNAHFMWSDSSRLTPEQANAVRVDNAKKVLAKIAEVKASKAEYADLPVIFGGDLNCYDTSDPCNVLRASLTPVYDLATDKKDNIGYYGTYASYDSETDTYKYGNVPAEGKGIDHIFAYGLTVRNYFTVTEFRALITSDHLPKIVDIVLNAG